MDDASLTQSGFVAGSPLYMAPEQARGESLDHRADLFSLGSVLYTMCTGRPPFRAANTLAVLRRVCEDSLRPLRETNAELPDWLADMVAKLMAEGAGGAFSIGCRGGRRAGQTSGPTSACRLDAATPFARAAGANGDAAGLPTSMTICPSCGANLHVPERLVGILVHCSECGKPFHVEEGSEVIQVARPVPSPFNARRRARRKFPSGSGSFAAVWLAAFCSFFSSGLPGSRLTRRSGSEANRHPQRQLSERKSHEQQNHFGRNPSPGSRTRLLCLELWP